MFRKAETMMKPMGTLPLHLGSIFVLQFSGTFFGQIAESNLFELDRKCPASPKMIKMMFLSELKGFICFVTSQKIIVDTRYTHGGDIMISVSKNEKRNFFSDHPLRYFLTMKIYIFRNLKSKLKETERKRRNKIEAVWR